MTAEKVIGVDLGYGFVKVTDGENGFSFPSVVGIGQDISYQSVLSHYSDVMDSLAVIYNGRKYFVGNFAIRQSDIASRSLDQNRVDDFNAYILFLTSLGLYAAPGAKYQVVTGLPTNYFSGYKDAMAKTLMGEHRFIMSIDGREEEKEIIINDLHIAPQSFGTLYDRALDNNGRVENSELAEMRVGIVDIGFKTADFVVADKMEFIEHLSSSSTNGMAGAYRMIAATLRRDLRIDKRDYELDQILEKGEIKIAGVSKDISEIKDAAFSNLALRIKTELESLWDYREMDVILLTGGGGQALADYLLPEFNNAILVDKAQFANCSGFWKLAKNLFSNDNRQQLKVDTAEEVEQEQEN